MKRYVEIKIKSSFNDNGVQSFMKKSIFLKYSKLILLVMMLNGMKLNRYNDVFVLSYFVLELIFKNYSVKHLLISEVNKVLF